MNTKELKEIIALMQENGLSEIEIERNGLKLKLKKSLGDYEAKPSHQAPFHIPTQSLESIASHEPVSREADNVVTIKSPMVGTFYASPAPDKETYVGRGKSIQVGDVLCIVEAMKLMNEIKSEVSGKVLEILVENGQPVEFDQPLFKIQKA